MAITRYKLSDELRVRLQGNTTLLTPSYRLAASVTEAYGSAMDSNSWQLPNVVAVDQWISQSWHLLANCGLAPFVELEILDTSLEKELWLEAIEDSREQHPLIDASAMAQIAARAFQDLQRWGTEPEHLSLKNYADKLDDVALYLDWREKFLARCRSLGRITLVEASSVLAQTLTVESLELIGHITLLDFHQPPPNYAALFERFRDQDLLDSLYSLEPGSIPDSEELRTDSLRGANTRYEFLSQDDELAAAASWAYGVLKEQPSVHIGFLSPNPEQIHGPLYQALLKTSSDVPYLALATKPYLINSSSGGIALADTAVIHDALAVLELNRDSIDLAAFCQLLDSPFLAHAESEASARSHCQRSLRRHLPATTSKQAIARFTGAEGKDAHCPHLHEALLSCRTLLRGMAKQQTSSAWSALFREQLSTVGWPNNPLGEATLAALEDWENALLRFEAASEYSPPLSISQALSLLRRTVGNYRARGEYRQQCPLSLYTPAEAVGLSFDHLWLLGFDDQSWPPPARANPLIPIELQRSLGIPGSSASLSFAKALNELQLVCANVSETLIASHHSQDDELPRRVSPIIESLPLTESTLLAAARLTQRAELSTEDFVDARRIRLRSEAPSSGGHSVITQQSQCPFQAFIKSRLGIQALEPFKNSVDARDRGSVVHWALEAFYAQPLTRDRLCKLIDESPEDFEAAIDRAVASATQKLQRQRPEIMGAEFTQLERLRLKSLLKRFLKRDSERENFVTGVPEEAYSLTLGALTLRLKIDRIDTLADQSLALIDYKTGKTVTAISALQTERPEDMQLPVYYRTVSQQTQHEVSALAIAQAHNEAVDYHALSALPNFDSKIEPITGRKLGKKTKSVERSIEEAKQQWSETTQRWVSLVEQLAEEFVAGECRVTPITSKTVCDRCGLQSLCRIKELDAEVEVDEDSLEIEEGDLSDV